MARLEIGARRVLRWLRTHHVGLLIIFVGVLVPLAGFGLLVDELLEDQGFFFDKPILLMLHGLATPWLDRAMIVISLIGYRWGVMPVDLGVALLLALRRRWGDFKFWALAIGGAALLNLAVKGLFGRVRPDFWESIAPETTFSFPSGHAMGSMALVLALWVLLRPTRWWRLALALGAAFVLLVGVSRVYLGVHFPSDILAGWAASTFWVIGLSELLYNRWAKPTPEAQPAKLPV